MVIFWVLRSLRDIIPGGFFLHTWHGLGSCGELFFQPQVFLKKSSCQVLNEPPAGLYRGGWGPTFHLMPEY